MLKAQFDYIAATLGSSLPFDMPVYELWLYSDPETWQNSPRLALDAAIGDNPRINWDFYADVYEDVRMAGIQPRAHFRDYGINEKRLMFTRLSYSYNACLSGKRDDEWEGGIDEFVNGVGTVAGMAQKRGIASPQYITLKHDDQILCRYLPACGPAAEGGAGHGFSCPFEGGHDLAGYFSIHDPDTLATLHARPYYLPEILPEADLLKLGGSFAESDDHLQAYLAFMALYLRHGLKSQYLLEAARHLDELGKRAHADMCYDEYLNHNAPTVDIARHALTSDNPTLEQEYKCLGRYFRLPLEAFTIDTLRSIQYLLASMLDKTNDRILMLLHDNVSQAILIRRNPEMSALHPRFISIFEHKIAILSGTVEFLKSFVEVLKSLPPYSVDIIVTSKKDTDLYYINKFKLNNFRIIYSADTIYNYKVLIFDTNWEHYFLTNFDYHKFRVIMYPHGSETGVSTLPNLYLASSYYQVYDERIIPAKFLSQKTRDLFAAMKTSMVQEISITGPFRNNAGLANVDRRKLRDDIGHRLGAHIPDDKPLVFVMEDNAAAHCQLCHMMNKLADSCTIIFKYVRFEDKYLEKLSPAILVDKDVDFSPDEIRFASDFIMCGPWGSTPLSCIMFGLTFLPYYSRILQPHWHNPPILKIESPKTARGVVATTEKNALSRFLKIWPYYFDLVNLDAIKNAIFKPEYQNWYHKNLPWLRQRILGEFTTDGCARKAAEHVVRFAGEGTLGEECGSYILK